MPTPNTTPPSMSAVDPAEIARYRAQMDAIAVLMKMPAWTMFADAARAASDAELQRAFEAKDAHAQSRHLGAAYAIKNLLEWPDRELQAYKLALGLDATG